MYKTLKFSKEEGDQLFFTSDCHFNHDQEFIWGARGYTSVNDHRDKIINLWNQTCDENSIVFHLGDFVFRDPEAVSFNAIVNQLQFNRLYLMLGNHNSGQLLSYKTELKNRFGEDFIGEVYPLEQKLSEHKSIIYLPTYVEIKVGNRHLVLSHYPIASWHNMQKGSMHLHGHCHNNLKFDGDLRRVDVGIERYRGPYPYQKLKEFLLQIQTKSVDHHV